MRSAEEAATDRARDGGANPDPPPQDLSQRPNSLAGKVLSVAARIQLLLAVLAALNLVTHIEELGNLSQSLAWIVAWCRFFVRSFFAWLNLEIPPLGQDALTLLALIFAAANYDSIRRHRSTMLPAYFLLVPDSLDLYAKLVRGTKGRPLGYLASAALVYALYVILFIEIPLLAMFTLALVSVGLVDLVMARIRVRDGLRPYPEPAQASPVTPLGLFANWFVFGVPLIVANAHRAILRSAGLVLLLVGLDFALASIADPLASLIERLPAAPE
jgi:hypothetical protein